MKHHGYTALAALLISMLPLTRDAVAAAPQQFNHSADLKAVGADPKAIAEIDAVLRTMVDQHQLSSAVGFVVKRGNVVYQKAFGWRDVENKIPASMADYHVLFSQTKAITTVAFMTLVEQGLVSIDDPVSKYFPGIPARVVTEVRPDGTYDTRPATSPMTFVHLMTHTSGLGAGKVRDIRRIQNGVDDAPAGFGGNIPTPTPAGQHTAGGNFYAKTLEEEMLALAKCPLGFDPGTHWEYHLSTNMLGYLIERISGQPLRQYVKEKVLVPLGMDQTDWYYEPAALARFVKPYRAAEGRLEPGSTMYSEGAVSKDQTYAEGAIGLNGPIEDYAKFCQMLLNRGEFNGHRILKAETVDLMTKQDRLSPDSGVAPGFKFGLGFELYREKKPVPAVSDSAFAWGGLFGTSYIIDPGHELVALFYTNMYQAPELSPKVLGPVYQAFATPQPAATTSLKSQIKDHRLVIENGGTGPYSAVITEEPTLPGMTIYRPADLNSFGGERKLPVLLWGNGACANTTFEHKNFLNEIASHGYIVIGIGRLDQVEERGAPSKEPTSSRQLLGALDWIAAQNASASGAYAGKIDVAKVAAMGMSCGGLQAIEISADPRITTTVVCNSGVLPEPSKLKGMPALSKDALTKYHGAVLYIMGGPSDIAYNNAMDDFSRVTHVPIVMTNLDVGHAGTYSRPHGGEFTPVALSWLDWQLKGASEASKAFLDEESELRRDSKWSVQLKNFTALRSRSSESATINSK